MKKILCLLVIGILSLSLVACKSTDTTEDSTQLSTENFEKIPNYLEQEMGNGDLTLTTPSGTSKENKAVLFVAKDAVFEPIGLETFKFDGSKMSYIYIDGNLYTKEQLSETQKTIDIQGDALKPGVHTFEVVQFDNVTDEGKAVTYKTANYEIKEK